MKAAIASSNVQCRPVSATIAGGHRVAEAEVRIADYVNTADLQIPIEFGNQGAKRSMLKVDDMSSISYAPGP
jgi:hypothetical protein